MKSEISDEQLGRLKDMLEGTCMSLETALDNLEIDASVDDAEDRLLDGNAIERCCHCDWWFESAVLENDESDSGPSCEDCRPELFE